MPALPRVAIALALLLATFCVATLPAQTSAMAAAADAILARDPAAARAHWGISVVDASTGATLYARNDAQLFEPASNAKLFTTSAALALLGPRYTMSTRIVAEGAIDSAGTLHGTLRLVGGADPSMSGRVYPYAGHTDRPNPPLAALDTLAGQVLASGIRAVDGPVLADDTIFPDERYGSGWGWDDLQWEYGAPISALVLNDNVRYLTVKPGAQPGASVEASWLPAIPSLPPSPPAAASPSTPVGPSPNSSLATVPGSAPSPLPPAPADVAITAITTAPVTPPALGVARLPGSPTLRIYGGLPLGGVPVHLAIALDDPARFAAEALRAALLQQGIAVSGPALPVHRAPEDTQSFSLETRTPLVLQALAPGSTSLPAATGRVVATRQSVPLGDIVTVTNKVSQNLHAELLLRLLGRAQGSDGSAAQGARVVRAFAVAAGVAPDDFLLYDGSGLSTKDQVTPRAFTTLLRYSTTQPWGALLRYSLPASGMDGTLASRFPTLRGRVQAKTGTLGEVDTLSGFVTANSGRILVFSVLCNDHPGLGSRALIDALVQAAAQNF